MAKNTSKHTGSTAFGKAFNTIPDVVHGRIGIVEIKDRVSTSLTPQLQSMVDRAKSTQQPMSLVVSPKATYVSGPTRRAVESTGGAVYSFDPASGAFTPW